MKERNYVPRQGVLVSCVVVVVACAILTSLPAAYGSQGTEIKAGGGDNVDRMFRIAIEKQMSGKADEAKRIYLEILGRSPEYWMALDNIGIIYYNERQFRKAEDSFRKSLRVNAGNVVSLMNLADLYCDIGKYSEAARLYPQVTKADPRFAREKRVASRLEACRKKSRDEWPSIDGGWFEQYSHKLAVGRSTRDDVVRIFGVPDRCDEGSTEYKGNLRRKDIYNSFIEFFFDDRDVLKTVLVGCKQGTSPTAIAYLFDGCELEAQRELDDEMTRDTGCRKCRETWRLTAECVAEVDYIKGPELKKWNALIIAFKHLSTKARDRKSATAVVEGFEYLREETFSCGGKTNTVKIYRHGKTGLEFVLVPGGTFWMGSPDEEEGRYSHESPRHRVTVKPFLICRTECTQDAWDRIGGDDARRWRGADLPIEMVSWNDVTNWCNKAGLRLPSETEWEYACRSQSETRFCFGESAGQLGEYDWYAGNSGKQMHPVGKTKSNAFGLFDMHGNVAEWCHDVYYDSYASAPDDGSARDGCGLDRVVRGGSWLDVPQDCRPAFRLWLAVGDRSLYVGFRPARSIDF